MNGTVQFSPERIDTLRQFLSRLHATSDAATSLHQFFGQFSQLRSQIDLPRPSPQILPALSALAEFFGNFSKLFDALSADGEFANPWTIARLGRSELMNATVLAWLLNPQQTHGQGPRFLHALLSIVKQKYDAVPVSSYPNRYDVREEAYILDNMETRVDILIDGLPELLILIEIKIDAPEGKDQVSRNLSLAQSKAAGKPNCVFYLCPIPPQISHPNLFHITWQDVASAIFAAAHGQSSFASGLLLRFAQHVRQF